MKRLLLSLLLLSVAVYAQTSPSRKVRVLLDTDAFNEIDDQFFIAYSLSQPDFEIEAIVATQYHWEQGSVDESYYEVLKTVELMGLRPTFPIVRGADVAMTDEKSPAPSPGAELIARLAMKADSRPLYILAVGALTNVGSALVLHPEIKPRIKIIWLGGFPENGAMVEFNARNDRASVKTVFESGVDLTVVPTDSSARFLPMPYREAQSRFGHTNLLGKQLLSLLRDYGERGNKVIWDISTTAYLRQLMTGAQWFPVTREPAPKIDLASGRYIRRQGPHTIAVCGKPDRDAVFADFQKVLPPPRDQDPPYLLSAFAFGDLKRVSVLFSEAMDAPSMTNPACYSAGGPMASVEKIGDQEVVLNLSSPLQAGATLHVSCARDRAGNPMLETRKSAPVGMGAGLSPGLRLSVFAAPSQRREIPAAEGAPIYQGTIPTLDWPTSAWPAAARPSPSRAILCVAEGVLYVPLDHRYELHLLSHKMARIHVGGRLVLDQGSADDRSVRRTVFLRAGAYPIRIEQYTDAGRPSLTFQWSLPFHDMSVVADSVLFHNPR